MHSLGLGAMDVTTTIQLYTYYRSVWKLKCTFVFRCWGQIPTELDPETRSNGSGLKNGAERDQN